MEEFESLGLTHKTLATLDKKGFKTPTEIQSLAIPLLMANEKDIIAQAQTGTGKTAVFGLPLIEKLDPNRKEVQALILAPTRELVIQVCEEIDSLKGDNRFRTAPIYGGQYIDLQLKKLKKGVHIVVGTPGRILDHIRRGSLILENVEYFILDEADEMLNMGFIEDIETIFKETPTEKRVLLFSATMPGRIKKLAENYMGEYDHVKAERMITTDLTEQIYYEVSRKNKLEALSNILEIETDFYGIIFCRTKADVDELNTSLQEKGFKVDNLHGDISQPLREKILGKFRDRKINILVATDVAARGIDVEDLTHVINYAIPQNPEAYVHRIGRTGRAGKKGTAITFVTPAEFKRMDFIKKFTKADIKKLGVPRRHEMVDIKKKRVREDLGKILESQDSEGYREWAKELMEGSSEEDLISALLRYSFGKDLEDDGRKHFVRNKEEKMERSSKDDDRHKAREYDDNVRMVKLSFAMGKREGMTKKRLIDMIFEKAGTKSKDMKEMEIHDNISYLRVPASEAKSIIKFFRRSMRGKEPLVKKVDQGRTGKRSSQPRRNSPPKRGGQKRFHKKKGRNSRERY